MHNLWTVISFEFLRTIKKKTFWLSLLSFPAIMVVVFALMFFSGSSADKAEQEAVKARFSLAVLDESKLLSPQMLAALEAQPVASKEAGIEKVRSGKVEAFFYYPSNPAQDRVEVFAQDVGMTKNGRYEAVADQLLKASVVQDVGSPVKVAVIQNGVHTNLTTYIDGHESDRAKRMIAPAALLVLFYLIIILLGNQMLSSTTEEKENRVMEMILTAVQARTLIVGKIVALALLGAVQIAVIVVPAIVALVFFGKQLRLPAFSLSQLQIDPLQMLIGVLLFIGSFLLFTGILVAIGASVPTAKEANNFFGIAVFAMFVPLYAIFPIMANPEELIVKFFSFFPLTAPVTLMLRNAVGNLQGVELVVGIVVLFAYGLLALAVATRAFSQGTLEYTRKLSLRELWPW